MRRVGDYNKKLRMICKNTDNGKNHFYLILPDNTEEYAFTRMYSHKTFSLCKSGIRLSDLMTMKSRDRSVMNLVKYVAYIMPYLEEYYDLKRCA